MEGPHSTDGTMIRVREFETLVLITLFLKQVGGVLPSTRRSRWMNWLASVAVILVAVHIQLEGLRWQMIPAYALTILLFLTSLPQIAPSTPSAPRLASRQRKMVAIVGSILGLLCLALAAALPALIQVFQLPEPTGPYAVGTMVLHLVDLERLETFKAGENDYRELAVRIWYPAQPARHARTTAYVEDVETFAPLLLKELGVGLPAFLFDHLSLVRTHAY